MRLVATALLVSGLLGPPVARASEVMFAYCPATQLGGTATYSPDGVSMTSRDNHYELDVGTTCDGGADAGGYRLTMTGVATGIAPFTGETCAQGHDPNGALDGTGPHGALSGSYRFDRAGVHYVITGAFTMGGRSYSLLFWLDVPELGTCPLQEVRSGEVAGHGAVMRHKTGAVCSLVYGRDRTSPEEDLHTGVLTGGPWVAAGAVSTRVTCFVSVGDATPSPDDVRESFTAPGPVGVLPPTSVSFDAPAGADVWVCADVTWLYLSGADGAYQQCEPAVGIRL